MFVYGWGMGSGGWVCAGGCAWLGVGERVWLDGCGWVFVGGGCMGVGGRGRGVNGLVCVGVVGCGWVCVSVFECGWVCVGGWVGGCVGVGRQDCHELCVG